MRYSVQYESDKNELYPQVANRKRRTGSYILIGCILLAAVLAVSIFKETIISWIVPGDDQVTIHAAEAMIDQLKDDTSISDAVTAFCEEILHNGK